VLLRVGSRGSRLALTQAERAADDPETRRRVELERRCVALIGGGCLAPVAAHHDGTVLTALVADEDGRWVERASGSDPDELAASLRSFLP
jgi:porphobilinogen deaminase